MYPGKYAFEHPQKPAFIMAGSGEIVSYGEYEARTNRLAHLLLDHGLKRADHYAIFMENNSRFLEAFGSGERAGLYYTCINSYLKADELAYILNNSESQILITSEFSRETALAAVEMAPNIRLILIVGGDGDGGKILNFEQAVAAYPSTRLAEEKHGMAMLYSSGTTGQPKGILRPMPDTSPAEQIPLYIFLQNLWQYREGMIYLSPAPLYHSAPNAAASFTIRFGGTVIIMENFDPEQYLSLIEKYQVTHSQLVPTMFSRMLKLPEDVRTAHDLSSLEIAIHAAAPCGRPLG